MSAARTQIYLSEEQRRRIDEVAAASGVTMAEVVRRALDDYLSEQQPELVKDALTATFGGDPEAQPPDRGEWTRG